MHHHFDAPRWRLIQTAAPSALPVTLDEVKAALRVDFDTDDMVINGYLAAAVEQLDGYGGDICRCLMPQTWQMVMSGFPHRHCEWRGRIPLPLPPVMSVDGVTYYDPSGGIQTLSTGAYQLLPGQGLEDAVLILNPGQCWPQTLCADNAVTIEFQAGYPLDANVAAIPANIKAAICMIVADLYENRESQSERPMTANPAVADLLRKFKKPKLL